MKRFLPACATVALSSILSLTGCGRDLPGTASPQPAAIAISGHVHGGQQPVSGSAIQLYAVGTSGDGSPSSSLLSATLTTDSNGNFSITQLPSCSSATQMFLLATGGNPGLGAPNPNLALMTALGPCSALSSQASISVNELTTVAAVYALAPYMTAPASVGASPANTYAINAAFALANQMVNSATGTLQGPSGTFTVPIAQLNTLADILAACVNSTGGNANTATVCGELFSLATSSSGSAPADTISALLNIAHNPTSNVASLYYLLSPTAPYQPTSPITPPDLAVQQTPSANVASGLQIGPSSLLFPSASLGVTTPAQTVVVSNPTSSAVAVTGITVTGLNQADFAQTNTCGSSLAPSASCTVAVTSDPQGSATRNASLSIASATPDSPQTVALAGNSTGIINGPHANVNTPIVRIYPGASYDVTLSNTGNAPLAITSIALAGTPFNVETNNCPSALTSGASCVITIRSIAAGADQLTIATNDPNFSSNILVFQDPNAPTAVFTPSNVFFADTAIGAKSQYVYSYNPSATVTPTISGPQASEFTATTPTCTSGLYPTMLPSCSFTITFNPASQGLRLGKVALDASGNYLPLAGTGTSGTQNSGLSLTGYLDFDLYPLPQPATLSNTSGATTPISIGFQSITGPLEYSETDNCGLSLAAHTSCTITVTPNRRTEGATQALLAVNAGTDRYVLPLSNVLYQVIDFGETAYSVSSKSPHDLYPLSDAYDINYFSILFASSAFQFGNLFGFNQCSVMSGTCVGEFTFNPTQAGPATASFTIANSGTSYDGQGPFLHRYVLLGTGAASEPAAKIGLQQSGVTSFVGSYVYNPSTFTISNFGLNSVNISGPTLSGTSPEKFTLGQPTCTQSTGSSSTYPTIAPGTQCTIPLTFTSTQTGFSTAIATVTDSISGLSFNTPLYLATLVGPSLAPSSLAFPSTVVNAVSAPQSITVTRDPTHPVTTGTQDGITATKGSCAAGEDPCTLTFVFAPTSTASSPVVSVQDVALGSSTALPVTATALRAVVHSSILANPGYLSFPGQATGTLSATQTITLTSEGPGVLNLYSIGFAEASAGQFTQTNNCGPTLAVNASCSVVVSFAPTSAGYKYDDLVINASSNTGLPLSLSLSGLAH